MPSILSRITRPIFTAAVKNTRRVFLLLLSVGALWSAGAAETVAPPTKVLPIPGEVFLVRERTAFLILPDGGTGTNAIPWVWYAPTLPALPGREEAWLVRQFLDAGVAVAGIDVGESYGSPDGRALFTAFHEEMVAKRGLASRPCLWARSRGGLMHYNWAVEHPESVAGIAGVYPVCNLESYPGLAQACGAYGLTEDGLRAALAEHNPVSRLEPLAKAGVPVHHIHGDKDHLVPHGPNSALLAERYRALGGPMTLRILEGRGHDMWTGWFQDRELVDFAIERARAGAGQTKSGSR